MSCVAVLLAAATFAGCSKAADPSQAQQAPPPAGVTLLTLEPKQIAQSSEFIATLLSLSSTTVKPEVEGIVTRIHVKSGDKVRPGAPILQINADKQQAAVRSTEAGLAGARADVTYWTQQVKRLESLLSAGAISRAEFDQARTTLESSEARLSSLEAQVREGRVQLAFYTVTAPQAGTVGDIPVRTGDRLTTSTVITTIDDGGALEAHIQVPIDRSPELRLGLPVEILDGSGAVVATNAVTFIAPRVDDATQTVLVKSMLRDVPPSVRVQQFVRARIVWRTVNAVTAPVTAVTRISGQYFSFVAEPGPQGGLVAKQRPIQVGELTGNDYVVTSGLKAGDRLIVSGIQKLGDGAPVAEEKK